MSNEDFDFRRGFYEISELVACRFPECEITVVDMVRLLCIENDTLRMTIGWSRPVISLPRPRSPAFLQMVRNQASLLQHGSMAKTKPAKESVMQRNGNQTNDAVSSTYEL
jgi:hypothetical protein